MVIPRTMIRPRSLGSKRTPSLYGDFQFRNEAAAYITCSRNRPSKGALASDRRSLLPIRQMARVWLGHWLLLSHFMYPAVPRSLFKGMS
jgi:hypothetical protein